jgi:hypothetical protein
MTTEWEAHGFAEDPAEYGFEIEDALSAIQSSLFSHKAEAFCTVCKEYVDDLEPDFDDGDCPLCENRMCVSSFPRIMGFI